MWWDYPPLIVCTLSYALVSILIFARVICATKPIPRDVHLKPCHSYSMCSLPLPPYASSIANHLNPISPLLYNALQTCLFLLIGIPLLQTLFVYDFENEIVETCFQKSKSAMDIFCELKSARSPSQGPDKTYSAIDCNYADSSILVRGRCNRH